MDLNKSMQFEDKPIRDVSEVRSTSSFSSLHHGEFLGRSSVKSVKGLGPIEELLVPAAWGESENDRPVQSNLTFHGREKTDIVLGIIDNRRYISSLSAQSFKQLTGAGAETPRLLYSDDMAANASNTSLVRSLAGALGTANVGDNQVVNPASGPDSRLPAFHLSRARVVDVNGKHAVAVDGWYTQMDDRAQVKIGPDGPMKRYYTGIFFAADGQGSRVDEMFLTADDPASFVSSKNAFSTALKSIRWAKK